MSERQTVAGAYDKIESHEQLCAERYRAINEGMGDMKGTLNKVVWLAVSCLIALVGWMGVQMWDGTQARIDERPAAASK